MLRRRLSVAAALFGLVATLLPAAAGTAAAASLSTIYDSTPASSVGNLPSFGAEAYSFAEFGDEISIGGPAAALDNAVVTMSSWACQTGGGATCVTTAGSTFNLPITLKIYNVGASDTLGGLLASRTQTFTIPFRPTSDDGSHCSGDNTAWYQASSGNCYHGLANNITFDLSASHVVLPAKVIYGISYNTFSAGPSPLGVHTPADSLNIGWQESAPTVGTDVDSTHFWVNRTQPGGICESTQGTLSPESNSCALFDGGVPGTPAVQLNAQPLCTTICYVNSATGNNANGGADATHAKQTIQAGVDAVNTGGTVSVASGSYGEAVTVNRSTTIQGAQQGTAGTRHIGAESVVADPSGKTAFHVTASGVTIDGFTVQGNTNVNQFGAGIVVAPGTHATRIVNNIIQNNIVGVFPANNDGTKPSVIANNLFKNNTQAGAASGSDIYADQFSAGVGLSGLNISGNTFTNTAFVEDAWALGISNTDAAHFSGITFTGNTVNNHGRGAYLYSSAGSTISGNTIKGASHYAVGLFANDASNVDTSTTVTGNQIDGLGSGTGVIVDDGATGSVDHNVITGTTLAVLVENPDFSAAPAVLVNRNDFTGNATGVENDSGPTLNALCNWWGNVTGPTNAGNPGGTGSAVMGIASFAPWLPSSALNGTCNGGTSRGAKQAVLAQLQASVPTGNKDTDNKLNDAIKHLQNSLAANLWVDDNHVTDKDGHKVFDEEKAAAHSLGDIKNPSPALSTQINGWIGQLEYADQNLAQVASNDAVAANSDPKKIAAANKEMTAAQTELGKGHQDPAFDHWRNAWDQVTPTPPPAH
jgi:parallel beta-helix repeat protein